MARPRQVSDEQILEAARRVFIEHGPAVSTSVVAKEVGVSAAALFKRFGTKEQLMLRALTPDPQVMFALLSAPPSRDRPIREQLIELATALNEVLRRVLPAVMVLRNADLDVKKLLHQGAEPPPVTMHRLMTQWLARAQEFHLLRTDTSPSTMAYCLMGAVQSRAMLTHLANGTPAFDPDYFNEVMDILFKGLEPEVP